MPSLSPNVVILLIIILVPVIPSFILFKFLPSTSVVNGPLQGLRLDLSGGFAGYFVIFFILIEIRSSFENTSYDRWTVTGQIVQPDGHASDYIDPRYVTFSVPSIKSDSDGNFSLQFLTASDGSYDFPHMYIRVPGYLPQTYFLGPSDKNSRNERLPASIDTKKRVIDLGVIKLAKDPDYRDVTCTPGNDNTPQPALASAGKVPPTNPLLNVSSH